MAHSCPDCGLTCFCNGDIDDCLFDFDEDVDACNHHLQCDRGEEYDDDYYEDEAEAVMKIKTWVDFGQEVEVNIGMDDIRASLEKSFSGVTEDRLGEPGPNSYDVTRALSGIAAFLNALTDEHIALLNDGQRKIIKEFLERSAERFKPQECVVGKD